MNHTVSIHWLMYTLSKKFPQAGQYINSIIWFVTLRGKNPGPLPTFWSSWLHFLLIQTFLVDFFKIPILFSPYIQFLKVLCINTIWGERKNTQTTNIRSQISNHTINFRITDRFSLIQSFPENWFPWKLNSHVGLPWGKAFQQKDPHLLGRDLLGTWSKHLLSNSRRRVHIVQNCCWFNSILS